MKKRIMSALLVSLASLGICTNANAMEKGEKTETGISNKINQDKNVEPTWNGRPISQELRLVHLPGINDSKMPAWKKYWRKAAKYCPERENLQDQLGKITTEDSYVLLADSKDQILGYCIYRPMLNNPSWTIDAWNRTN